MMFAFFVCFSVFHDMCLLYSILQARQVLEREFNNLLAKGTDRRLDEVSLRNCAGADLFHVFMSLSMSIFIRPLVFFLLL